MLEQGLDKALIEKREDSRTQRGWNKGFFSFRRMFWDYLNKLHVPFSDDCCLTASENGAPLRFDPDTEAIQSFDSSSNTWANVPIGPDATLKKVVGGAGVEYYSIPSHAFTGNEDITTFGFVNTDGTITDNTFGYDTISVQGGNQTSNVFLNKVYRADVNHSHKLKFKIENLIGDQYIGFAYKPVNSETFDTTLQQNILYFRFSTKAFYFGQAYGFQPTGTIKSTTQTSGSDAMAEDGDVLELNVENRGFQGLINISLINLTNNKIVAVSTFTYDNFGPGSKASMIGLVLAGADYTIYELKHSSTTPMRPALYTFGDSMASGFGIISRQSFSAVLDTLIPQHVTTAASSGTNFYTCVTVGIGEVLKLRPQTVLLFTYIPLTNGDFMIGDPLSRNSTYMEYFNRFLGWLVGLGIKPILTKVPLAGWPIYGNAHEDDWNAFVTTQAAIYSTLILDLSADIPTYDNSGYHYSDTYHAIIAGKLKTLLEINNII